MRGVPVTVGGVPFDVLPRTILALFAAASIIGVTQSSAMAQFRSAQLSAGCPKRVDVGGPRVTVSEPQRRRSIAELPLRRVARWARFQLCAGPARLSGGQSRIVSPSWLISSHA